MKPERWREVESVFRAALTQPPDDRAVFLDQVCGADEALRCEVDSLLAQHEAATGFPEPPATDTPSAANDLAHRLAAALTGRYALGRELGRGGMATVFLAHDTKHDRAVALKVMHSDLARAMGSERFVREVRFTARLQHPNILPLHDSGEAAGLLYYVMPYVEGETLRRRLEREGQLPVKHALEIAREVADALSYAHSQGIVHRDIKPENVLLANGHAYVADFGIARAIESAGGMGITETGLALGTPAYMSPEQFGSSQVDGRTDIYALGCVLYEMLAGEPPYTGPTPRAVLAKSALEPVPSVRTLRDTVPIAIEGSLLRALAKAPADRFQTAAEFGQSLTMTEVGSPSSAAPTAPLTAPQARRSVAVAGAVLMISILFGWGGYYGWRRTRPQADATGPTRVAVLPFENLGTPEDEYFSDGVTDEVRGKLAALPRLVVIDRSSSAQYKRTRKSTRQIGRELGVEYLLRGTVRWETRQGGRGRIRVSPELVQASTAANRWQQSFDAPLADVFQVQTDIARRVAEALGVALGTEERGRLADRPTTNLAAYDAFIRGEQLVDLGSYRLALPYYEQAVALDTVFADAWAAISRVHTLIYQLGATSDEAQAARAAAERALSLAPDRAAGRFALGIYFLNIEGEERRALNEFAEGLRLQPNNARLLMASAFITANLGGWEAALTPLRRAQALDPRSGEAAGQLAYALLMLRRYSEAHDAVDRAIELMPSSLSHVQTKTMVYLAQGDLPAARAVIREALTRVDPAALVAYFGRVFDLYWVLEEPEQQLLLRQPDDAFNKDRANWALTLAETYGLRGERSRARAYADSALVAAEAQLRKIVGSAARERVAERRTVRALALAYLGRKSEAVNEGERVAELVPLAKHAVNGPYVQHQLVRIYMMAGESESALDRLAPLLKVPYLLSPGWLNIDPNFTPLRGNPRFDSLEEPPGTAATTLPMGTLGAGAIWLPSAFTDRLTSWHNDRGAPFGSSMAGGDSAALSSVR